jgi:hypothetical protein
MRKSTVIAVSVAAVTAGVAGAVWASTLTLTTEHLGAGSVSTPQMFPSRLATANGGNAAGRVQKNDTVTVTYSNEVQTSTLCGGAPTTTGTQTLTGATVTIGNNTGSTGNDALTVGVPTTACTGAVIHFGSVDLGSASYVSGSAVVFSPSTVALTQTTTSATLVITLGNASGGTTATVSNGAAQTYIPDPVIADTAGNTIGTNLVKSSSTRAF